jgi:hypothetical protein
VSNVDSCPSVVLIPKDVTKAVLGPWMITNGYSIDALDKFAAEMGLTADDYTVRQVIDTEEAMEAGTLDVPSERAA